MFVGSVNSATRNVIASYSDFFKGKRILNLTAGNFTIENILGRTSKFFLSNDVSLYSKKPDPGWENRGLSGFSFKFVNICEQFGDRLKELGRDLFSDID